MEIIKIPQKICQFVAIFLRAIRLPPVVFRRLPESESLYVVDRDPVGRDPAIYVLIKHFFDRFC